MFRSGQRALPHPGAYARGGHRDDGGQGVVNHTDPRIWQIGLDAHEQVEACMFFERQRGTRGERWRTRAIWDCSGR
jgi:hypothetical protein